MKIAIAVFIVGDRYVQQFNAVFRAPLEAYCTRHSYDLVVLTELLRPLKPFNRKKFFWQRFLIPGLPQFADYDYVLTLDADILVSPVAPALPILESGKIGCINERKYLGCYEWREDVQRAHGWEATGRDWYKLSGEDKPYHDHIQGGFVLYQPKAHGALMTKVYEENVESYAKWHQDDQSFLSSYGIDNDLIQWVDQRYDCVWSFWRDIMYPQFVAYHPSLKALFVTRFMELNWFTHWTGGEDVATLCAIMS